MSLTNLNIEQCKHIILAVVSNPYFHNVINFIKYKFDKKEYSNSIILVSGNFQKSITELREKYPEKEIIAYTWEQLCGSNTWMDVDYMCKGIKMADKVWCHDHMNATYLRLYYGVENIEVYPFEYFSDIETLNNVDNPEIDVLFYGFFNERRANIVSYIQRQMYNEFNIVALIGSTVEQSYKFIENSKIVLNIHAFTPYARQEQERIGFLLGNKKCVVSEISQNNYFGDAIIETIPELFCQTISKLLKNDKWRDVAKNGYEMFKNGLCKKVKNFE